mmetsp:Transcript_15328/g.30998  ORF Transcript_15328/g.30998 Transcript_15328/m.30998 type:complete len:428 (-) Transcript_15328:1782-3065(-)
MRLLSTKSIIYASAIISATLTTTIAQDPLTNEQLTGYGLTLAEVDIFVSSESSNDFAGLPSSGETDQLWSDATAFEHGLSNRDTTDVPYKSFTYYPYLVCNSSPGKSRNERRDEIEATFRNTPGVNASHFYPSDSPYANNDNVTCGIMRARGGTMDKVYASNPNATDWLQVQPGLPSMKMVEGMVDAIQRAMDGEITVGVVSISEEESPNGNGYITRNILGVQNILCPGVQDFEVEDVPDEDILNAVKTFVIGNEGNYVKDSSFYHYRVYGGDGEVEVHTTRMSFWADSIQAVVGGDFGNEDGSNKCLDGIIGDKFEFDLEGDNLNVFSKISYEEMETLGGELGVTDAELEQCLWFMVMGLATNPLICSLEQQHRVQTLCPDGSSDLSTCEGAGATPEEPESSGVSLLSSRVFSLTRFIFPALYWII